MKLSWRIRNLLSYGLDWITGILFALFFNFYLDRFQHFDLYPINDVSLQYPGTTDEVIPTIVLGVIILSGYIIIGLGNLFLLRSWWDLNNSMLGVTAAVVFTGSITQAVRITVGRPRPDFFARCLPREGANETISGLVNISVCTTDTTTLFFREGVRSFFSGHASLTAASLGFASLYLAGKLHLFNKKGYTLKMWLVFTPISGSVFVSITRLMDHRHHPSDVIVGMQFYPPLSDPESHLPYPPRNQQKADRLPSNEGRGRPWKKIPDQAQDEGEQIMLVTPWKPSMDVEAGLQDIDSRHSDSAYTGGRRLE
ncbi:hypothetical protein ONZ45_g3559 [Pleurotus djamor]|nr:hypothetical protein ONZ45_g3559 [Pleurotus djamor]